MIAVTNFIFEFFFKDKILLIFALSDWHGYKETQCKICSFLDEIFLIAFLISSKEPIPVESITGLFFLKY